jgi:hypothetical protein
MKYQPARKRKPGLPLKRFLDWSGMGHAARIPEIIIIIIIIM